jgi:hypothetical protein
MSEKRQPLDMAETPTWVHLLRTCPRWNRTLPGPLALGEQLLDDGEKGGELRAAVSRVRVSEYWSDGVLEYSSDGVMECWKTQVGRPSFQDSVIPGLHDSNTPHRIECPGRGRFFRARPRTKRRVLRRNMRAPCAHLVECFVHPRPSTSDFRPPTSDCRLPTSNVGCGRRPRQKRFQEPLTPRGSETEAHPAPWRTSCALSRYSAFAPYRVVSSAATVWGSS